MIILVFAVSILEHAFSASIISLVKTEISLSISWIVVNWLIFSRLFLKLHINRFHCGNYLIICVLFWGAPHKVTEIDCGLRGSHEYSCTNEKEIAPTVGLKGVRTRSARKSC